MTAGIIGGLLAQKEMKKSTALMRDMQNQAKIAMQQAVDNLKAVGIPDIEAQKIALESPELQGHLEAIKMGESALSDVTVDPRLKLAQMSALKTLQEQGESGLTSQDRMVYNQLRSDLTSQEQARQSSILQNMAQRGTMDSGNQLAQQMLSSQASSRLAQEQGDRLAAQSAQARLAALAQAGQLGGQIRSQDFDEQAKQASAIDAIKQFDITNQTNTQAKNLAEKQRVSEAGTTTRNAQEQYNKGLIQQKFQNELAKSQSISNALTGQAQNFNQQGQKEVEIGQAKAEGWAKTGEGFDKTVTSIMGAKK